MHISMNECIPSLVSNFLQLGTGKFIHINDLTFQVQCFAMLLLVDCDVFVLCNHLL